MPEIQEFVSLFSRQGPTCLWHRGKQWGWQQSPMKHISQASFDSFMAISMMNSKWCEWRICAVDIEMSTEAAAFLNFGSSPFILNDGKVKVDCQKKTKGVIACRNLKPDDIGGIEADDLASIRDKTNAETVF